MAATACAGFRPSASVLARGLRTAAAAEETVVVEVTEEAEVVEVAEVVEQFLKYWYVLI